MSAAIRVHELSKRYRRVAAGYPMRTLKSALVNRSLVRDLEPRDSIEALRSVSFKVERGEALALIGGNGSGKSTLLKVVAGLIQPTTGSVELAGRVAALIELGAGFHPEISGRENVFINGAVLGLSRRQVEERYSRIVEFAELGEFMEEPVKNYSSGMFVRLGFSVAVHTDPEILLVDEVLSVGDEAFSHRCLTRIEEFLASGKTLLLVSHELALVEQLCDRALWLDNGKCQLLGPPRQVIDAYREAVAEREALEHRRKKEAFEAVTRAADGGAPNLSPDGPDIRPEEPEAGPEERQAASAGDKLERDNSEEEILRWGSREAEVVSVRLLTVDEEETYHIHSGEPVVFEIEARAARPLEDFVFGVGIATPRGVECWGTNTDLAGLKPRRFEGRGLVRLSCPHLRLAPGEYFVDVAVHSREGAPYDYRRKMFSFSVTARDRGVGVYFPQHDWSSSGDIEWCQEP